MKLDSNVSLYISEADIPSENKAKTQAVPQQDRTNERFNSSIKTVPGG